MKKTQLFEVSVSYGAVARGDVLVVLVQKTRKLGVIWAVTHLDADALSLRSEIYEVSNDNSDICGHPRPMMEGECSF